MRPRLLCCCVHHARILCEVVVVGLFALGVVRGRKLGQQSGLFLFPVSCEARRIATVRRRRCSPPSVLYAVDARLYAGFPDILPRRRCQEGEPSSLILSPSLSLSLSD